MAFLGVPDISFRSGFKAAGVGCRVADATGVEGEDVIRATHDGRDFLPSSLDISDSRATWASGIEKDGASIVLLVGSWDHADGDGRSGAVRAVVVEGKEESGTLLPRVACRPVEVLARFQLKSV